MSMHPFLPKLRGASPIQRAIADGEEKTGVTIMQMARGLDTGRYNIPGRNIHRPYEFRQSPRRIGTGRRKAADTDIEVH